MLTLQNILEDEYEDVVGQVAETHNLRTVVIKAEVPEWLISNDMSVFRDNRPRCRCGRIIQKVEWGCVFCNAPS